MSIAILLSIALSTTQAGGTHLDASAAELEAELDASLAVQLELCEALGVTCETAPPAAPATPQQHEAEDNPARTAATNATRDTAPPAPDDHPRSPLPAAVLPARMKAPPGPVQ